MERVQLPGLRTVGAVIAVAALALTACTSHGTSGTGTGSISSPTGRTSSPVPTSSSAAATSTPASADTNSPSTTPTAGFRAAGALAASFVGSADAWVLGTVPCGSARCTGLLYSTDDAKSWRGLPVPTGQGLTGIRFATTQVGYAFGPSALYLTTDGGKTWSRQSGGADALETLDGNVIRVSSDAGGCPPGCRYRVSVAKVGSSDWRTVPLPGRAGAGDGVQLGRADGQAYLIDFGNPAGGANDATSVLWTSADDGTHWTNQGEPCSRAGGREVDSTDASTAPDGSLAVLCTVRGDSGARFVETSDIGAHHFQAGAKNALGAAPVSAFGAASAQTVFVSSDQLYRSTDAGNSFHAVQQTRMRWIGFASPTVGHALAVDGTSLWSTNDAGATWTRATFS